MSKFTPGPWQWLGDGLVAGEFYEQKTNVLSASMGYVSRSEDDAALIAAAPDLYYALEILLETTKIMWKDHPALNNYPNMITASCVAEIALEKARGEV